MGNKAKTKNKTKQKTLNSAVRSDQCLPQVCSRTAPIQYFYILNSSTKCRCPCWFELGRNANLQFKTDYIQGRLR